MPHLGHRKTKLRNWPVMGLVLLAAAGIGYYIIASFASGSFVGIEVENGTTSCGAAVANNSSASGGKVVQFSACVTPTPTATPAPTPTPTGGVKPALSGSMDRGGDWLNCIQSSAQNPLPVTTCFNQQIAAKSYLHAQTFEIDWSFVEPSQGVYNWQYIDDAIAAVAGRGMRMRLKVETGVYSPAWAKSLGGAPVPFQNSNTYLNGEQTVPRYWTAGYKAAYNAFMGAMAARYDNNSSVAEVETCSVGLVSCESVLIQANDITKSDGKRNGQHLYEAGFNDSLHMQSMVDDLNYMLSVWHKTRIVMTIQPFHLLGTCPGNCGDAGGVPQITYDFIDGNHVVETPLGGNVTVTGLAILSPSQALFFHTGLGPKEIGGTAAQPTGDATTIGLYNYVYNANGVHNRSNRVYAAPLQTETYGRLDVAWAPALNYACGLGAISVELPHGYSGWEKLSGSWAFGYPTVHTDTTTLSVLNDANACFIHNGTLH